MPDQDLIEALKQAIKNDKDANMNAIVGRIPVLCQSVLAIHEGITELKEGQKEAALAQRNLAISMMTMMSAKDAEAKYMTIESANLTFAKKDGTYPIIKTVIITGIGLILVALLYTALRKLGIQPQ